MKKLIKLITVTLSFLMMFTSLVACGGGGGSNDGSLEISIYEKGFGYVWLETMAADYEEKTGVSVTVIPFYDQDSETALLQTDSHSSDVLFFISDMSMHAEEGHLTDITDLVYNQKPYGQESGKTIKELAHYSDVLNVNRAGRYYSLSYSSSVQSLLYNKTTLDGLFGENGWEVPRTTNEWIALLNNIKDNHSATAYPMVSVADYMEYLVNVWWAQYDGQEKYFDYWRGYDNGEFCAEEPTMAKSQGRLEALSMLESVYKKDNGYMHSYTGTFLQDGKAKDGQRTFLSKGYSADGKKVAFFPCGDWFANEMGDNLMNGQDVRMMNTPVLSTIVNTFEDATDKAMTDAQLSEIIKKIDENKAYSLAEYGCQQSTYEKVKQARKMIFTNGEQMQAFIPSSSKNTEEAARFLRYMVSDAAQSFYAKELDGLQMGYGYDPTQDENVTISSFVQSVIDCVDEDTIYIYRDFSHALSFRGGLAAFTTNQNKYTDVIYTGTTAKTVFDDTYNTLNTKWKSEYLKQAGLI